MGNRKAKTPVYFKVRMWSTLSTDERKKFTVAAYVLFPEIFGATDAKYAGVTLWLASKHGVVSTSMRDNFSAGGTGTVSTGKETFYRIPQSLSKIRLYRDAFLAQLGDYTDAELRETWKVSEIDSDRLEQWLSLVSSYTPNIAAYLRSVFDR